MLLYAVTTETVAYIADVKFGPHQVTVFKDGISPAIYTSRKKADKLAAELNDLFPDTQYNVLVFNA